MKSENKNPIQNREELLVVGIASSAGGMDPLKELIAHAICHGNMAFILVPHLSRDFESNLPHIMSSISSLKILPIQNGLEILACHLYVLPPGFYARVQNQRLYLDARPPRGVNFSANILFQSLAEDYGRNAIGVVLSGAAVGSDGSEGVIAIKKRGGHTYAQSPSTASFPHMPQAAIETGSIDSVLDPKEIGNELTLVSWASD